MLNLGHARGRAVDLTDEERTRHLHVVGASGTGKSKFLEHLIRQDILKGRGLCLIDPHGTLVEAITRWCASRGIDQYRRIHVITAGDERYSPAFNPLRLDGSSEPSVRVDAMVAACAQVWGGADMAQTPRLKKTLRAVFYALAVRNLTLAEAPALLSSGTSELRRHITSDLPDYVFRGLWEEFNSLSRREFVEVFESTSNRMGEFLSSPPVRRIVGQTSRSLDLRTVMNNGDILLVNLLPGTGLSPDNVRLLGTLLTSDLFLTAMGRSPGEAASRPFTLYVDECYDYLTSDIERMLDQTRKFGLHLVLAHQRLSQLKDRSKSIYNGVMAGGQTKVAFGGMTDDDAEIMVREIFRSAIDLERPKHILDKSVVVGEVPFWLESETETVGGGSSWSTTHGQSWGDSQSSTEGSSERLSEDGSSVGGGTSSSAGQSSFSSFAAASTYGGSTSWSRSRSRAQTLRPVRRVMPTAVYSLEEEMHLAMVKLRELPRQAAIVKRRGRPPIRFQPADVKPPLVTEVRHLAFQSAVRDRCAFIAHAEAVDREMAERRERLGSERPAHAEEPEYWRPG